MSLYTADHQQSVMPPPPARPNRQQKLTASSDRWDQRQKRTGGQQGATTKPAVGRVMTTAQLLNNGANGGLATHMEDPEATSAPGSLNAPGGVLSQLGMEERRGRSVSAAVHNLSQALNHIPMRHPGSGCGCFSLFAL